MLRITDVALEFPGFAPSLLPTLIALAGLVDGVRPGHEVGAGRGLEPQIHAAGLQTARQAHEPEHAADAARRVGAAAEADQKDAVARIIGPGQKIIAVADVPGDSRAGEGG